MITAQDVRDIALSLEGAEELPHFDKTSFRVKKRIFATLNETHQRACVKLSAVDQSAFGAYDPTIIYPVPNAYGKQGWTLIDLTRVSAEQLRDAISTAYWGVAMKRK